MVEPGLKTVDQLDKAQAMAHLAAKEDICRLEDLLEHHFAELNQRLQALSSASHCTGVLEDKDKGQGWKVKKEEEELDEVCSPPSSQGKKEEDDLQKLRGSIASTPSQERKPVLELQLSLSTLGHKEPPGPVRACAQSVSAHPAFRYGSMLMIGLNLMLLGLEADISARSGADDVPRFFIIANTAVVAFFVLELAVNFTAEGCRDFFRGNERSWNIFDFIIIALSVVDACLQFLSQSDSWQSGEARLIRAVRVARAFRAIRVVRLLRYVGALRALVLSITCSMQSLLWTMVLLILMFYSFGVLFTELVADHCRLEAFQRTSDVNAAPQCLDQFYQFWSSVPESMLTLLMVISGGLSWIEALAPLREVSAVASSCFLIYITFAVFAIINVVTGVFCSTAVESAANDKEIAMMKQYQRKQMQVSDLRHVFREIVDNETNLVSLEEFEEALATPRFASFLESMSISTADISTLFTVMDADKSGLIDLDEFVFGCLQLHGPAKSLQVAKLSFENKSVRKAVKALEGDVTEIRQLVRDLAAQSLRPERFFV
ncbi:unnamed protein product [Effrenium voratum]|nr:unnamed protein product [Effrenium voratum]CAJ1428424.1 unnamed protein product [Effrenium voratum]CAJ1428425.1 unnamed protein product [Effrenium voratum]